MTPQPSAIGGGNGHDCYEFGPFRLDSSTRELWRGEEEIALTPKAFELLRVLVTSGGGAIEKQQLLTLVWRDSFVSEDSLTQNIATLRKALGDSADRPQFIVTVPRHGYRFAVPVRILSSAVRVDDRDARDDSEPIDRVEESVQRDPIAPAGSGRRRAWAAVAMAILIVAAALMARVHFRNAATTPDVVRFVVTPPQGTSFSASASLLAVSPNGRLLAFLASRPGEPRRIWIRALDSLTARELPGTDGAVSPFWSPDSHFVAFFADDQLKKIGLVGEPPEVLCRARAGGVPSGAWHANGVILFFRADGIYKTSANGESATQVTSVDRQRGESAHILPGFLPDGRHFVYTARVGVEGATESWIMLRSLDRPDDRRIAASRSQAFYANGQLLFLRDGALVAQRFDADRLQLVGEPAAIPDVERVGFNPAGPRAMFSVSENGVLTYRTSPALELGWFDRAGASLGSIGVADLDRGPALSHDGQRVAVTRYDPATNTRSLWILDAGRGGVSSPLTSRNSWDTCPVWSPDDTRIIFARRTPNGSALYEKDANRGIDERLVAERVIGCPIDWSADGRYLLYGTGASFGSAERRLWLVSPDGGAPQPLEGNWPGGARTPQGRISPNGRWLAYESETAGRTEIFVRSFPDGAAGTWQISSHGGIEPQWRRDGRELFFLGADQRLMAVPVETAREFRAERPMALFKTALDPAGLPIVGRNQYLPAPDGQRFLINQPPSDAGPSPVTVVVNWPAALMR